MRERPKETEIASGVVRYLSDLRWEVFQEVTGRGGRADIVARQGSVVWVVETKTSFGFSVLEQAYRWKPWVHLVSVGVPYAQKGGAFGALATQVLEYHGIGVLAGRSEVREYIRPRLNRKVLPHHLPMLCDEHKTYADAGTNGGGFYTPFNRTCRLVSETVKAKPGITIKDLVREVDHHYHSVSSARNSLMFWIRKGHIDGVRLDENERPMKVYPAN